MRILLTPKGWQGKLLPLMIESISSLCIDLQLIPNHGADVLIGNVSTNKRRVGDTNSVMGGGTERAGPRRPRLVSRVARFGRIR